MQTADRTAMAGIAASLAGAVMTTLLEKVFPNAPPWIWQSLFVVSTMVLAFSLAFLLDEHVCRPHFRRTIVGPALLMIISSLGFIAGIAWALTGKVPLLTSSFVLEASPTSNLSDLSNAQLRERASRFTAQLREFEAQHAFEERRISEQETQEMLQQLPVITTEDREREMSVWQKNQSAMMRRRAEYEAAFNARFRSRALEFREELYTREGTYPPYKPDVRSTAALDNGILPGINPISQVGDYLDELIRKLPD
jgi:hypothetical protein